MGRTPDASLVSRSKYTKTPLNRVAFLFVRFLVCYLFSWKRSSDNSLSIDCWIDVHAIWHRSIAEQIKHQLPEPFVGRIPIVFAVPEQVDGDLGKRQRQGQARQSEGPCATVGETLGHRGDQVSVLQDMADSDKVWNLQPNVSL